MENVGDDGAYTLHVSNQRCPGRHARSMPEGSVGGARAVRSGGTSYLVERAHRAGRAARAGGQCMTLGGASEGLRDPRKVRRPRPEW